ncbi:MAG: HAD family hydrolase [Lachnospiraceae bacterium]|nr:HAD family hydrolase [Lachnospiraceae bacterium]
MNLKVILFDLDGTLLPMDQDIFVKKYFGLLVAKLSNYGYHPPELTEAIWKGTGAMIKNHGAKRNEEVFWDVFASIYGDKAKEDMPLFDEFYQNEFDAVQEVCGYNPQAAETVAKLKEKGYRIVLATNPIFPPIATQKRMKWAGFSPEDFELYTTYENSRYSKPNIEYYKEIVKQLGVKPEECLMVGNDVGDDMVVQEIGMKAFLLTDCLINKDNVDISIYPNGNFEQLLKFCD